MGQGMSFHYLSPLILPIFSSQTGTTEFTLNINGVLDDTAVDKYDVRLSVVIESFRDGQKTNEEKLAISVCNGLPDVRYLTRSFGADALSYAVISISADRNYFRKLHTEHVYSFIKRPDNGTLIINASYKYGDPLIIDLMRRVGKFCLCHPAQYISEKNDIGNSTLIINPFDGAIVATIKNGAGKVIKKRIRPRSAYMLSLVDLLENQRPGCLLYTGNNRYPAWDVRHSLKTPSRINRIDHLEFFRGSPTTRRLEVLQFLRLKAKKIATAFGYKS